MWSYETLTRNVKRTTAANARAVEACATRSRKVATKAAATGSGGGGRARCGGSALGGESDLRGMTQVFGERRVLVKATTPTSGGYDPALSSSEVKLNEAAFDTRVEDIMMENVVSVKADAPLMEARKLMRKHKLTGVPVVVMGGWDEHQPKVVGVISRKDMRPYWKRADHVTFFNETPCSSIMSKPAVTVRSKAHLAEAAGLMLAHDVYRLPVLNQDATLVGVIARSDVFLPLLPKGEDSLLSLMRKAELNGERGVSEQSSVVSLDLDDWSSEAQVEAAAVPTWKLKYLYDGDCSLCRMLKDVLSRGDERSNGPDKLAIKFVNIADFDFDPELNMGITYEQAMKTIHVIRRDESGTDCPEDGSCEVLQGTEALEALYDAAGLGYVSQLMRLPVANVLAGLLYRTLSFLRIPLDGRQWDALLAARRMRSAETSDGAESADDEWACTSEENEEDCGLPDSW